VLDLAQHLYKQANERITTHKLNDVVKQVLAERRPSTASGRKARVYYATQTDVAPPTIVLFVNNPVYFDATYQRYMVNRFRELLPYGEVPIRLIVRQRERQQGKPTGAVTSLDDAGDVSPRPQRAPGGGRARSKAAGAAKKPKSVGGVRVARTKGPRKGVRRMG
jgi:GTP-binding protein